MNSLVTSPPKLYTWLMPARTTTFLLVVSQIVVLAATAIALYGNTLDRAMNTIDDRHWLEDVEQRDTLAKMFDPTLRTNNSFATTYYLPSQSLLYFVLDALFDGAPRPYRIVALAIHIMNAILLLLLIYALTRRWEIAMPCAMLFVAHVANEQSVTWVPAAFSHPLATSFILTSVLCYHRYMNAGRKVRWGVLSLSAFVVGWTVRETLIIVPIILALLELACHVTDQTKHPLHKRLFSVIPFCIAAVPFVMIAAYKYPLGKVNQSWGGVSLGTYPFLRFLDFSSHMVWPAATSNTFKLALSGSLLLLGCAIIYHARRLPMVAWSVVWIAVALAPYTISNFNTVAAVTRYLYPGLVGLALFLALVAAKLIARSWTRFLAVAAISIAAAIHLYLGLT